MKKLSLIFLFALTALFSKSVEDPHHAAANFIASRGLNIKLADACSEITKNGSVLAYAFSCDPSGYVVVSADDRLIPVIAYSDNSEFEPDSPISELIKNDLESRLSNIDKMDNDAADKVKMRWLDLLSDNTPKPKLDQWPPDGSTSTGGWTETRWNQTPPYNKFCPMDLSTSTRSYTGCPATAMSQILFYHRTVNGTRFEYRRDRYYHNYTQDFWIDDASATYDFLDFDEVNVYLDSIDSKWAEGRELSSDDIAALNWACGIATKSVFSSSGSGTFGVDQAYDAFIRFGFSTAILLDSSYDDKTIKTKMADNIKIGLPVHLATVNETWTSGHNVVCDGYNSDDYFRLNFGWGGSADGWYSLPEGFPYSLTVFEGIVADINLPTGIEEPSTVASEFELFQNYPNPFNPATEIKFSLADNSKVNLSVYNTKGQLVRTLLDGKTEKGYHTVNFDASELNSGMYLYRIDVNGNAQIRKMIMLK